MWTSLISRNSFEMLWLMMCTQVEKRPGPESGPGLGFSAETLMPGNDVQRPTNPSFALFSMPSCDDRKPGPDHFVTLHSH